MAFIRKVEPNEKFRQRILICRKAGLKVSQDFRSGKTEVLTPENAFVLVCTRKSDDSWQMDYNDEFWDEKDRSGTEGI